MILHDIETRHASRSDEYILYPIGDIHIGAAACDLAALKDTLNEVAALGNAFWIGTGDYAESIVMGDKRFDIRSVHPRYIPRLDDIANACFSDLADLFSPIKSKCLGLLIGNHEETLRLRHSQDVHGALCLRLGLKNLGYDSMIRWRFKRGPKSDSPTSVVKIFASHGTITGRRDGAKMNRMSDLAMNFDADLYIVGHGHSQLAGRSVRLEVPDSGELKLRERLRMAVMSGTFRKSYERDTRDYSEKSHHQPPVIGCPRIVVRPWAEPRRRLGLRLGD